MRISKEEGVVQHVNKLPGGRGYTISDFYDSDSTVISFEDGRRLNESVNEAIQVQRNDMLRHEPTGLELRVSVVKPNRISGVVTKAGDLSSKLKVGDVTAFKPVLVGSTWKKFQDLSDNIDPLVQRIPLNTLEHGIRFELDQKGLGTDCTVDEYEKAKKAAIKNLQKDLLYYRRKEGAQDMPVSKTDQMVKAKLKESVKHLIKKVLEENTNTVKKQVDKLLQDMSKHKAGPEYKKALIDLIKLAEKESGKTINTKKEALKALDYVEPTVRESVAGRTFTKNGKLK
jgi:hypothetical protein